MGCGSGKQKLIPESEEMVKNRPLKANKVQQSTDIKLLLEGEPKVGQGHSEHSNQPPQPNQTPRQEKPNNLQINHHDKKQGKDQEDLQVTPRPDEDEISGIDSNDRLHLKFTKSELRNLKTEFQKIDTNNDGFLEFNEIHQAMNGPDNLHTVEDTMAMIEKADVNRDGLISFREYVKMHLTPQSDEDEISGIASNDSLLLKFTKEELRELKTGFREIDLNNDGFLEFNEIHEAMNGPDKIQSVEDTMAMLELADVNRDGKICFREYVKMQEE